MTLAILSAGLLLPSLRAGGSKDAIATAGIPAAAPTRIENLHPFTHVVYLPEGADPTTIRFEKVRPIKVATRVVYSGSVCESPAFREPGGSIACPSARSEGLVKAYEATYSFSGRPLASDEQAGRYFTFNVRFRPDELPADVERAVASGKLNRADLAAYFLVTTYRQPVNQVAVDLRQSRFCDRSVRDGSWTPADPGCRDDIHYETVSAPSGYLTVKVEPVARLIAGLTTSAVQ
jgi:hypothetical protein